MNVLTWSQPQPLRLVGAVRGLVRETAPLERTLDEFAPTHLALGLSGEDVSALRTHFPESGGEPLVPLHASEAAYARALARFGEVRVPSPAFLAALRWASRTGVPLDGIDLDEDSYGELFVESISYRHLLRRTVAERSLTRSPPTAATATELALAWELRMLKGSGSKRLAAGRDNHLVQRLTSLHPRDREGVRLALVVDVERIGGLQTALAHAGWSTPPATQVVDP